MKNNAIISIVLTLFILLNLCILNQAIAEVVVVSPAQTASLKYKWVNASIHVINATYANIEVKAKIVNPFNQTLPYIIEINAPQPYYYSFDASNTRVRIEISSEKIGKLNASIDEEGSIKARGVIEANSEDSINIKCEVNLTRNNRVIWREIIESNMWFSIRSETMYEATPFEEAKVKVVFSYPKEYIKMNEKNYQVEHKNGYKVIKYEERFYGTFNLRIDIYKPRIPINSLIVFSALWIMLITFTAWVKSII